MLNGMKMSDEEYLNLWKEIEAHGLPNAKGSTTNYEIHSNGGTSPFWKTLQDSIKSFLAELLTQDETRHKFILTIDDDKQWCNCGVGQGLRLVRHTNDNRDGFNLQTAALSASGLIVGLQYEECNDAKDAPVKRLLKNCFANTIGESYLSNTCILMDWGYWTWSLLFFLVQMGAMVAGTIQRQAWFAYTYNQTKREKDTRQHIPEEGRKLFLRKQIQVGTNGPFVSALAYRDDE